MHFFVSFTVKNDVDGDNPRDVGGEDRGAVETFHETSLHRDDPPSVETFHETFLQRHIGQRCAQ